jgi:hypothetical protein
VCGEPPGEDELTANGFCRLAVAVAPVSIESRRFDADEQLLVTDVDLERLVDDRMRDDELRRLRRRPP